MKRMLISMIALASAAYAGGMQMPQMGGPMRHVAVHLHEGTKLEGHVDPTVATPLLQNYGEMYMPPANVLDGRYYNAQYGWMVEGLWSPPAGSVLWIEQTSATAGLSAYLGGMMSNMEMHTFEPIFGTAGSSPRIQWNGMMLHNWYAADATGTYSASYRLYFGDTLGTPTPGYTPAEVTLEWIAVPEPSGAALLGIVAAVVFRRSRT